MLSLWCKCANGLAAPQDSRYRVMRTEARILAPSRVCRGRMWCWGLRFSPWLTEDKRWHQPSWSWPSEAWLGTYKWRDAKNLQFLMVLLGSIRDLFLESGKHLHWKHYIFVGISYSSDQYLLVVNYSKKRLVVLLKNKYDWPQNKSTTNLRIDYKISLNIMLFQIWVPHISIPIFHFVRSIQMCQGDWVDVNTAEIIFERETKSQIPIKNII